MSIISREESYLSVDCKECNFNLLLVHDHDELMMKRSKNRNIYRAENGDEIDMSQWGPPDNIPYEV